MTDDVDHPETLTGEVRELLFELGARSRDLEPLPGESQRAERDLAIILDPARDVPAGPSAVRRAVRPVLLFAVAAVLAVGLVIVRPVTGSDPAVARTPPILQIQDGGTVLDRPTTPAADELLRLAKLAGAGPMPAKGPVQRIARDSWYLSIDEAVGDAPVKSILVPVQSELYVHADGTIRSIERRGSPLDSHGYLSGEAPNPRDVNTQSDETFEGSEKGPDYPKTFSHDPVALAEQLLFDSVSCEERRAFCLVSAARSLHYGYVLEPRLKAALLAMFAQQPDIRFAGVSTDRLGRRAEAYVLQGGDAKSKIILLFNPKNGAFLGSEEILVKDSAELGIEAPAVIEFSAIADARRIPESAVPDVSLTTYY